MPPPRSVVTYLEPAAAVGHYCHKHDLMEQTSTLKVTLLPSQSVWWLDEVQPMEAMAAGSAEMVAQSRRG